MLRIASVICVLCVLLSDARKYNPQIKREWEEFQQFLDWKRTVNNDIESLVQRIGFDEEKSIQLNNAEALKDPLFVPNQDALLARNVVNQADWAAVATISTRRDIETFPVANLVSIGDGPVGNGTGIPYMYLTPLDFTAQDVAKDHRATLLVSLAQGSYCKDKELDPMDPRCARVMLSGKIKAVKNTTAEHEVAKKLFFNRHPKLENMPKDHDFFIAKLKIVSIALLHTFGGPKYISVHDYFNPTQEKGIISERIQHILK
ncbi:protein CREG1 [Linepithema humile]|uniref:protein CREG1 n=1 Tax=Linepithema humile TaxID=83485 RepID=UPI000623195A|nr:PREDICTED: protein CREG1 [Linepithema humile]